MSPFLIIHKSCTDFSRIWLILHCERGYKERQELAAVNTLSLSKHTPCEGHSSEGQILPLSSTKSSIQVITTRDIFGGVNYNSYLSRYVTKLKEFVFNVIEFGCKAGARLLHWKFELSISRRFSIFPRGFGWSLWFCLGFLFVFSSIFFQAFLIQLRQETHPCSKCTK